MTDQTPTTPIVANSTPAVEQWAAGIRQLILVLATAATILGATKLAGEISAFLAISGPLAGLIVIVIGQLKTRQSSQNLATLANKVPDSVAVVK